MKSMLLSGVSCLILGVSAAAHAAEPNKPKELYRITIKDGAQMKRLLQENAWMKELTPSNLFQGLTIRLSPLMAALPQKANSTWQGRLIDFLLEKVLSGRQISTAYFSNTGLVSPFGLVVHDLSPAEHALLEKLIDTMKSGAAKEIDAGVSKGRVTPLNISTQKLGVRLEKKCLMISRDPKVVLWMSNVCMAPALISDAQVTVYGDHLLSSMAVPLEKWVGTRGRLNIDLRFDGTNNNYVIASAQMDLKETSWLKTSRLPAEILDALPAETQLFSTLFIPNPGPDWNANSVNAYLKRSPAEQKAADSLPVVLFDLGTSEKSQTGLLISGSTFDESFQMQLSTLFGRLHDGEVMIKRVCGNRVVVLSPYEPVVSAVTAACNKSRPRFSQKSAALIQTLREKPFAHAVFFSMGQWSAHALDTGWKANNSAEPPPELIQARKILAALPSVFLYGEPKKNAVIYSAQSGEF